MEKVTETSKLQNALIEAGLLNITFTDVKGGTDYTTDITTLPDVTLIELLRYGKRKFNDSLNSSETDDRQEWSEEWLNKAQNGTLGAGSSGSRVDPLTRELREVVLGYLTSSGFKTAEARKLVKVPFDGFETYLTHVIATKQSIPVVDVDPETVKDLIQRNWATVTDQAQKRLDAKAQSVSLDITI